MKRTNVRKIYSFAVLVGLLSSTAWGETEVGKVVSVSGKVMARVESKGSSRRRLPQVRYLKPSDAIYLEDVINTDSNGSVKILFEDQSIMDLGQSSLFKVEHYENKGKSEDRKVEMSLSYGKIRAAINQKIGTLGKFKIKTRAATMGVRGTEFYVMSDIESNVVGKESRAASSAETSEVPQTKIVVTEGKVEVAAAKGPEASAGFEKPVAVLPGEKFTATLDMNEAGVRSPASVPVVEKVAPEEMKTVVSDVKLKDTTFVQAIQIEAPPPAATTDGASGKGGQVAMASAFGGAETLSAIKDTIMAKPEIKNPAPPVGGFAVPGAPVIQPNFTGNFMPGFITKPLVKLNIIIR